MDYPPSFRKQRWALTNIVLFYRKGIQMALTLVITAVYVNSMVAV